MAARLYVVLWCVCTFFACNSGGLTVGAARDAGASGGSTTTAATGGATGTGGEARAPGAFFPTGSMAVPRSGHTATLLASGAVLIAGGWRWNRDNEYNTFGESLATAELYDPMTGTFAATGGMSEARHQHAAALLPSGKVLIAGGWSANANCTSYACVLTSAELYDPESGTFTATGGMKLRSLYGTATSMPNGQVLFAGGAGATATLRGAELYDPATGTFVVAGSMIAARQEEAAALLGNGKVLIAGGAASASCHTASASAELFDIVTGAFVAAGTMRFARMDHTMTLLGTGKVLIVGGWGGENCNRIGVAEVYDPSSGTFATSGKVVTVRGRGSSTLLSSGKVLFAGGVDVENQALETAEAYDPASGMFTRTGEMNAARAGHTATLLPNGEVLIVGGDYDGEVNASAELYRPL